MEASDPPIQDVLAEIDPDWQETTRRLADEGRTDEEIVAYFQSQAGKQVDGMLDLYSALRGTDG